jgi:hypothetical protein
MNAAPVALKETGTGACPLQTPDAEDAVEGMRERR